MSELERMKWLFIIVICLCIAEGSDTAPSGETHNSHNNNDSQKRRSGRWTGNDILENEENPDVNSTTSSISDSEESLTELMKALDLPPDFLDVKKTKNADAETADSKKLSQLVSTDKELYMTGSSTLDRIMHCPCHYSQLTPLGIQGYVYHNHPTHSYSYGTSHGHDLSHGSKGSVFGQLVKLLLGLPSLKLALLKPLILGLTDTAAKATLATAELKAHAAKHLPGIIVVKAEVLKKLVETFGDATGSLLYVLSHLLYSAALAKKSLAEFLPYALDILGHKSEHITNAVGVLTHGLADTTKIVSHGVLEASKAKGQLVSNLIEGGHHFKAGVLEGMHSGHHQHHHNNHVEQSHAPLGHRPLGHHAPLGHHHHTPVHEGHNNHVNPVDHEVIHVNHLHDEWPQGPPTHHQDHHIHHHHPHDGSHSYHHQTHNGFGEGWN